MAFSGPFRGFFALFLVVSAVSVPVIAVSLENVPTWAQGFDATNYARGAVLNPDNYVLYWSANAKVGEIRFAAIVKTGSWVALGISANGGMKGADIAVLFRDLNTGAFRMEDRWATEFAQPTLDSHSDKILNTTETKYENGVTHFVFQRKLRACDDSSDLDILDKETYVIRAFGYGQLFEYHGPTNRGTFKVNLLTEPVTPIIPTNSQELEVLSGPYNITSARTQYICTYHTFPSDKKYHVVISEPKINSPMVHHMIIYKCLQPGTTEGSFPCDSMMASCVAFWEGWAVGGRTNYLPAEAGLAMGDGDGSAVNVVLQVHYDNPTAMEGQSDPGSGFKLTYTDQLRQHDVGVLTVGDLLFAMNGSDDTYSVKNECPYACTRKFPTPLNVIGNGFHMHQLGLKSWTQLIRNNTEITPLGVQNHFDFNHQNPEGSIRSTVIMPGDRLIHHCEWNSTGLNRTVRFGESTTSEMCFNFIQYYPRMDYMLCGEQNLYPSFAICAPEIDISDINSLSLADLAGAIVSYTRNQPYAALPVDTRACTTSSIKMLCGDGKISANEDCDSTVADHCLFCACQEGYQATSPPTLACEVIPDNSQVQLTNDQLTMYAAFGVAGLMALILLILIIVIGVRNSRTKKAFQNE